jgi:excinuclease ABC subunit C
VAGLVSEEEYAQQVDYVRLFLAGKDDQVLTQLIARMEKASQALEFEEAARIRDQIQAVRRVTEKQFVSNTGDDLDGVAFDAGWPASTCCLSARAKCSAAAAISRKCRAAPNWVKWWKPLSASSICRAARCARCREILLDFNLGDKTLLADSLSELAGRRVNVQTKPRGDRARYLKLARTNARRR